MDKGHIETDKELQKMERRIFEIYARAQGETEKSWREYMEQGRKEIQPLLDQIAAETDEVKKKKLLGQYQHWLKDYTLRNQHYMRVVEVTAKHIEHSAEIAADYLNEKLPEIYGLNYNYVGRKFNALQAKTGISFELVDKTVVKKLILEKGTLLPYRVVDGKKAVRWNTKRINAEVLQGILQGESMDKIAKRLQKVEKMDAASSIRNARTAVTSAENSGRMDRMKEAVKKGVIFKKKWIATPGTRTRKWHAELDGTPQDLDKPFTNAKGDIMFPGDPNADPANVYGCRCTLGWEYVGVKKGR